MWRAARCVAWRARTGFVEPVPVVRVDDKDERVGVAAVVAPEGPNFLLAAHVPHRHLQVAVLEALRVEPDRRRGRDVLVELQPVEDGGLARAIEAEHEDAHVAIQQERAEDF